MPARLLAKEMSDAFGFPFTPEAVADFVKNRWSRIHVLAHAVHETEP